MHLLAAGVAIVIAAAPLAAQTVCPGSASAPSASDARTTGNTADSATTRASAQPDSARGPVAVMILAAASVGEVRFNAQPQLHVRLCGSLDSVHVLARQNLPTPVVTGTTYRNVYVAVEIFARVNAECVARQITGTTLAQGQSGSDCASLQITGAAAPRSPPDSTRLQRR